MILRYPHIELRFYLVRGGVPLVSSCFRTCTVVHIVDLEAVVVTGLLAFSESSDFTCIHASLNIQTLMLTLENPLFADFVMLC